MLRTSSLLIDDVQDDSVLRRGIPVAHNIFGIAKAINSANCIYFLEMDDFRKLYEETRYGDFHLGTF